MSFTLSPLFSWRAAICDSNLAPTTRLVALTLSLHMNERGGSAFPSQATLVRETGLSLHSVRDHLQRLRGTGWLVALTYATPGRSVEYAATIPQGTQQMGTSRNQGTQENPTLGTQQMGTQDVIPGRREPNGSLASATKSNPVWDALAGVFGEPSTDTARKLRGKVCSSLTRAGASPDEIVKRAKSWPRHFSDATLTETALEKHWDALGRKPLRVER